MKPLHYLLTWAFLPFVLPLGIAITLVEAVTRKDTFTFKWRAFGAYAKKGDLFRNDL